MPQRLLSVFVPVFVLLASSAALADKLDPGAAAPIEAIYAGINANDSTKIAAAYGADATIVDEFAPFHWSGPKAVASFWSDFAAFTKSAGASNFHGSHANPTFVSYDTAKTSAYVVMPTTFTYRLKGKAQTETGRWVFVLKKGASGWRVSLSAWATVSDTGA